MHIQLTSATNSRELLDDIIRTIREEPKRILMEQIIRYVGKGEATPYYVHPVMEQPVPPDCGTQGCILGWLKLKLGHVKTSHLFENPKGKSVSSADIYLKFPTECHKDLKQMFFGGPSAPLYPWPTHAECSTQAEYAEKVIVNIEKFITNWEPLLTEHNIEVK